MAKVNSLLTQRLKMATEKLSKMTNLVEMSSSGNLSSFSGVFRVTPLSEKEKEAIQNLLEQYKEGKGEVGEDLNSLFALTAEVKAINNQAIILHGERIKAAQGILKNYRDGAFSAWLIAVYGNRQTPYNFLQYYELYTCLPEALHLKLDEMPRQAIYSLASREGSLEEKKELIRSYNGEAKQQLLQLIREKFPLSEGDKRAQDLAFIAITTLGRLKSQMSTEQFSPSEGQKKQLSQILKELQTLVKTS